MTTTSQRALLVFGVPGLGADGEAEQFGPLSVVEQVDRHLPGAGLVLVHDDRADSAERGDRAREAAVARAALGRDEIVIRSVSGPLSRFLLLARVIEQMQAPVGVAAASIDRVITAVRTVALLASVSHLEEPAPSVAQHGRGLLPGGCFLVDGVSVQTVKHRLPRGIGRGAEATLVTGRGQVTDWPDRLWSALGPAGDQPEPVVISGRSCWGTTRWAEISLVPAPTTELAAELDRTPTMSCAWCARTVAASQSCPFCGSQPGAADATAGDQTEDHS
jgi:hypothetical protein